MADPQTTALRLSQPVVGGDSGTWPVTLNNDWTYVDQAVAGSVSISINGLTTYTLTADGSSSDQARYAALVFTGALSGDCTVTLPSVAKGFGWVSNQTSGSHNVILTCGGGQNLTVPPCTSLQYMLFSTDGSNTICINPWLGAGNTQAIATIGNQASTNSFFAATGQSTGAKGVVAQTNNLYRWFYGSNSTAESGSNVGSDFVVQSYNDAGVQLAIPLTITRSTGAVYFSRGIGSQQGSSGAQQANALSLEYRPPYIHMWVDFTDFGAVTFTSDRRLKSNIRDTAKGALARVMAWSPRLFNFTGADGEELGFVADEMQKITPQAVYGDPDAVTSDGGVQPQSLKPLALIAELAAAIQELNRKIDDLDGIYAEEAARS